MNVNNFFIKPFLSISSVLSDIEQCCEYLSDASARLGILFGSIRFNQDSGGSPEKSLGIVSRLGYILGNIMARNDQARVEFYGIAI